MYPKSAHTFSVTKGGGGTESVGEGIGKGVDRMGVHTLGGGGGMHGYKSGVLDTSN